MKPLDPITVSILLYLMVYHCTLLAFNVRISGKKQKIFKHCMQRVGSMTDSSRGIPVVGIGGSAGSLAPFKTFFTAMPADSGAAFAIIQHLAPDHESLLAGLLSQHTSMRVVQARDAMIVELNCVYVIPPNQYMTIRDGVLSLTELAKHPGLRTPIDFFFRSLAEDRQEQAICIIFSGAGSDGTLGVRAVRGAGGLAIVQDPETAQFGDMPRSAIATGLVDFVLSPDQMPEALLNYLRHPYVKGEEPASVLEAEGKHGGLQDILLLMQAQKGSDFRYYKKGTILRRIERRMGLHRIQDMAHYYELLRQNTNEVAQLFKDLLINVTTFFRDAETFEELRQKALAPLARAKQTDEPMRVWVAGCASGEEAYTLAMLLIEEVSAVRKNCPVQIFATDIDEDALEFARKGIYPESIANDVGPDRLTRFFIRKKQGYQVNEQLRKSVVYAAQNLITDPPFSKMDLISCRNLLIYLDSNTQAKLIPLFNFALNPGGYLFLGKSEGVGSQNDLFDVVSKNARLFRRLSSGRHIILDSPILPGKKRVPPYAAPMTVIKPQAAAFADTIRKALLRHFAASVVLIDRKGQILQFHGQTGKYLNMPVSEPTLNLLDIAKEGLSSKLRSALHKAVQDNNTVMLDSVSVTPDEGSPVVRVTIVPASQRSGTELFLAVIFEDIPRPAAVPTERLQCPESETTVKQLEDELRDARQELQATIEELQSSNEELRAANEEVVSTNEELQSTVEELETSREELQSVNEELTVVNNQLQDKVERLDAANSDLDNFLKSTELATLFLDRDLKIRFFTPATSRVLKLIPTDVGRPINDLSMAFIDYDLIPDLRAVAAGSAVLERAVWHADGSHYIVRILPYRAQMGLLDGTVVTFNDITRLKLAEEQTRRLATVLTDSNDAVLLFDPAGAILTWNRGAREMYGWSEAEALRMMIHDMTPVDKIAEVNDLIRRLTAGETIYSFETQRLTKDGRILDIWLTATALRYEGGKTVEAIASTERDITQRKKAEQELRERTRELESVNKELDAYSYSISHDLKTPLRSIAGFTKAILDDYADKLDETGQDYFNRVLAASHRMTQLIDALLSMARWTHWDMNETMVNLSSIAEVMAQNLKKKWADRDVEFIIPKEIKAKGDLELLRIVIENLFDNAWKFTWKHPKAIIEFGVTQIENKSVYFVRDDGAGFDMKYSDKLFKPFMRLHADSEFPGIGIGLSIVHRIISRHGGKIWAEAAPEKGATFYFTLE